MVTAFSALVASHIAASHQARRPRAVQPAGRPRCRGSRPHVVRAERGYPHCLARLAAHLSRTALGYGRRPLGDAFGVRVYQSQTKECETNTPHLVPPTAGQPVIFDYSVELYRGEWRLRFGRDLSTAFPSKEAALGAAVKAAHVARAQGYPARVVDSSKQPNVNIRRAASIAASSRWQYEPASASVTAAQETSLHGRSCRRVRLSPQRPGG
jgi:hypothetical protein